MGSPQREATELSAEGEASVEAIQDDDTLRSTLVDGPLAEAPSSAISMNLQGLTDRALDFLSGASNETLGACLAGLGATTYLILGRVGLLIIGVAGGVILHATWEGVRHNDRGENGSRAEDKRRKEIGLDVVKRVLDFRDGARSGEESEASEIFAGAGLNYADFEPQTEKALNIFTDAVIKDYVYYWYGPTVPGEEAFPSACRRTFVSFMLSLSNHLQRKRPADAFLDFVTNASSILIVFLNELAAATNASPYSTPSDAVASYLTMKPESSLAYMLNQHAQNAKLEAASEDILKAYLDPKAYNCSPVHVFLNQILSQLVLGSTVTLCSRPEWLNEWIVYGLEESETTKEVMDMVDAGVEGRTNNKPDVAWETSARSDEVMRSDEKLMAEEHEPIEQVDVIDEAMEEAKRLTQLMIAEDERRTREHSSKQDLMSSSGTVSETTTQGAATPTSSQSDRDLHEDELALSSGQAGSTENDNVAVHNRREPVRTIESSQFTSFDQLVSTATPTALSDNASQSQLRPMTQPPAPTLTLHNAKISIFDDSNANERTSLKAKPSMDYLIQIEPSSAAFTGWMIVRKYVDFETLHEVLRRISVITGVSGFAEAHQSLPQWKVHTKTTLRVELERYLTDAVRFQPLAESEGLKRFLEKEKGMQKSPGKSTPAIGWPTPDAFGKLGGDMMNVLTKAPKQGGKAFVGGGKAVFGGVAGLVGGVGNAVSSAGGSKRPVQTEAARSSMDLSSQGRASSSLHKSTASLAASDGYASPSRGRQSQESLRISARPGMERHVITGSVANSVDPKSQETNLGSARLDSEVTGIEPPVRGPPSASHSSPAASIATDSDVKLPPPPSEMPEDYILPAQHTLDTRATTPSGRSSLDQPRWQSTEPIPPPPPSRTSTTKQWKPKIPLSETETSVAIELMFAVITELYTLSSAWNIRRTLLAAAKTYLLRPGNPQLLSIRGLLQSSLLDANLSDEGLASLVYRLRENGLPTEEELRIWKRDYPEKNEQEKEELRVKARKLLVTKGMPAALQSVMGAAASAEALGKVFDCLQVEEVARALVFGIMVQALKVITH